MYTIHLQPTSLISLKQVLQGLETRRPPTRATTIVDPLKSISFDRARISACLPVRFPFTALDKIRPDLKTTAAILYLA